MSNDLTINNLIKKMRTQNPGLSEEAIRDMPISALVCDGHLNHDMGQIFEDYPMTRKPDVEKRDPGNIRIKVFLTRKRLVVDKQAS